MPNKTRQLDSPSKSSCCDPSSTQGCCTPPPTRREFLQVVGLSAAAAVLAGGGSRLRAFAGPFTLADLQDDNLVPIDKKLDPEWVKSLFARGEPTVYTLAKDELKFIGMPIGGICCGSLYLGGDGRLWHWDIFNLPPEDHWASSDGPMYAKPARPASPIEQGFALRVTRGGDAQTRRLDSTGFKEISFRGQYPIGLVDYVDAALGVKVGLEAFSPFVPLCEEDSSIPATVLNYTVTNTGATNASVDLAGWLQNAACLQSGKPGAGTRHNTIARDKDRTTLLCSARPAEAAAGGKSDILFEDFEKDNYDGWTTTGTAFGAKPRRKNELAGYQGDVGAHGEGFVNTHETRHGENVVDADKHIGTLTSREFVIERAHVAFRIGGGNHPGQTSLNLLVDNAPVRTATGKNDNRMRREVFDVRDLVGKKATIQIVDAVTGSWGQIGIDEIIFTDHPERLDDLRAAPDFGTMALSLLGAEAAITPHPRIVPAGIPATALPGPDLAETPAPTLPFGETLIGSLSQARTLKPGESATFTFILAWHFPTPRRDSLNFITDIGKLNRHYAKRFDSAGAVAAHVATNLDRLTKATRLWRDTWYDSTLPFWFLDRTFATVSTAATSTCHLFDNGRFYGWEGEFCCAGTCTHVWQYAQGLARIFPSLERAARDMVDYGLGFHDDTGAIDYRGEAARSVAHDGQCGTILRAYREHLLDSSDKFLKSRWARVKKSIEHLIREDANDDGILEGSQYNTLDAAWYGPMAWISSLYIAALRAGDAMAKEMNDDAFAKRCRDIADRGGKNLVSRLFNGEYFIHRPDAAHPEANSTNDGCHIDQVFGQSWAFQVGLPRVVPKDESLAALRSLWKYSFAPDVGAYRKAMQAIKGGRWYAMPGEGGLLMCTFPKGGADRATGKGGDAWAASYFNECMSGFEHQVASHMLYEGLVMEGLALTRVIHDRYHAARRNPWNEVECGNHYARAMAAYGSYLGACGFEFDRPAPRLAFAPRLTPENFKAAFTTDAGWGTYSQTAETTGMTCRLTVHWGSLSLKNLVIEIPANRLPNSRVTEIRADRHGAGEMRQFTPKWSQSGTRVEVDLGALSLDAGSGVSIMIKH